jgi:hypothetical protein
LHQRDELVASDSKLSPRNRGINFADRKSNQHSIYRDLVDTVLLQTGNQIHWVFMGSVVPLDQRNQHDFGQP